ncbi:MAG: hypothetical protein IIV15_03125, partial [Ruminococcus sp.]|nr:hypothetical protein [Ruminococcus sp.]
KRARSKFGNAVTAVISSSALKPLIFVRLVIIRKVTLSFTLKTIDKKMNFLLQSEPLMIRTPTGSSFFVRFYAAFRALLLTILFGHEIQKCLKSNPKKGKTMNPNPSLSGYQPQLFGIGFRLTQTCA